MQLGLYSYSGDTYQQDELELNPKNENYVFIDRVGRWNKYNEIKEVLGIKHISNFDNKGSRKKK